MRALAIILLVAVFARHGAIHWLAGISDFTPAAMSYMLGGAEEVILAGVIAVLLLGYRASVWRNLSIGACAIAAIEGAQITGCRALIADIRAVPNGMNICDHATGLPIGQVVFSLEALWILTIIALHFAWWVTDEKSRP